MIVELNKNKFYKCQDLINEQGHLEVKAVVGGNNPGRIFVDNITSPQSGLVWLGDNDGFFFIGNADNSTFNIELNDFIDNIIIPEAKAIGLHAFEGIGNHPEWYKSIEKVFSHRQLKTWKQKVYTLQQGDYENKRAPMLKDGYLVSKITQELYLASGFTNINYIRSKILKSWHSPESFFRNGLGYCIIHNDEIVSLCYSNYVTNDSYSISIETLESHQKQGLAKIVAYHYVSDCFYHDLIPYWDCMEENKPSIAVAEYLGFKNVFDYKGYVFSF